MRDILEYKGYLANVYYSPEDEAFYGKIFGINDVVTFESESAKQLKSVFIEAVEDYIETCKKIGKAPQKSFKGSFNVRIPGDLHKDASFIASQNKVSLNDFVKYALLYAVKHKEEIKSEFLTTPIV